MSNNVAIRALRVDPAGPGGALDVQRSDLGIHLEIVIGLDEVSVVRGTDGARRPGRIDRIRVVDVLPIELLGWVQGVGADEDARRASFRGFVQDLQAAFDPTIRVNLEVDLEDGTTIRRRALPLSLLWGPETIPALRQVSVALESSEPEWTLGAGS